MTDLRTFVQSVQEGRVSALATVDVFLSRIQDTDQQLRCFQFVDVDGARAAAQAIDEAAARGDTLPLLAGVVVGVKELFQVKGFPPATAGTRLDVSSAICDVDTEGTFVASLRRLGCIFIGTTKTTEFALTGSGVNDHFDTPRNPNDTEQHRLPGGSSSGSGVAVAVGKVKGFVFVLCCFCTDGILSYKAGLCHWAVGTDTGGSVRAPAAFNGICGLKTSVGIRGFETDGCFPLSWTLDSIGIR